MKLRITYDFKITDVPSEGAVFIENDKGYVAKGDNLQHVLNEMREYFAEQIGDDFTLDIVDVNPAQDAEMINRELSLLPFIDVIPNDTSKGYDPTELFALVRELLETNDTTYLRKCIAECHNGNLRGPIDQSNLHLFRRYRNEVSGNPQRMIEQSITDGNLRTTLTNHPMVEDWEQNAPDSFTCFLEAGYILRGTSGPDGATVFTVKSLAEMLDLVERDIEGHGGEA
jgi:hypothetical protein